jgi:hypothetical protein
MQSMKRYARPLSAALIPLTLLAACGGSGNDNDSGAGSTSASVSPLSFFITSVGSGKGADLGGLAGADQICQKLATSVDAGKHTWRAYLSTNAVGGAPAVNARDRIGAGPWRNAKGVVIAQDIETLHGNNNINKETALTEKGDQVNGSGDQPNNHDILTGSQPDGRAFGSNDTTCSNWTSSSDGAAMLGHHDRRGTNQPPASTSWNSSHLSRGCSQDALRSTGSGGLLYCFAAD